MTYKELVQEVRILIFCFYNCNYEIFILGDKTQYVAERLKKIYNGHQEAVKDVSFKIPKGKCYGLLGVNGAGKSSVFKMLVGDELMNNGNAYIKNPDKVWIGDVEVMINRLLSVQLINPCFFF